MKINYPRSDRQGIRRFIPSWKLIFGTAFLGAAVAIIAVVIAVKVLPIPQPNDVASAQISIVAWEDGSEMVRLGETNRISVPLSDVSDAAQKAILAAEDRQFYEHGGFSASGIGRAVWNNITGGATQGGSTITQQYAKNAYLTDERTYTRKVKELILSLKLETSTSKDDILNDYLNTIYFGRGAYGIETAAQTYFGTSAKKLTVPQSAVLASVIKAPSYYQPEKNPDLLRNRYAYVLDGMLSQGWITQAQHDKALKTFPKIKPRKTASKLSGSTGFLVNAARKEALARGFTEEQIDSGGLRITTTFNKDDQAAIRRAVAEAGPQYNTKGVRIGIVSMKPETGEVVAMYGGDDFLKNQYDNALQATAQAGSTYKPFALAAAFEQGITLDSRWDGNSPRTIAGYTVPNQRNRSWGNVSLLRATENSINTPFVDLTNTIGAKNVLEASVRAGVPADTAGLLPNLTVTLGSASPHVIDMAAAYSTFANRGERVAPVFIKEIRGANNGLQYQLEVNKDRAFSEQVADTVNYALQKVVTNGSGFVAQNLGRPSAGKTGTTDDNKSSWYIGYTPQLVTAVMMAGEDEKGHPATLNGTGGVADVTGATFPSRMWLAYMRDAVRGMDVKDFASPAITRPTDAPSLPSVAPSESASASASASESPSATPSDSATSAPSSTPTQAPPSNTPTQEPPSSTPTQAPPSNTPTQSPPSTPLATPTAPAPPPPPTQPSSPRASST